MVPLGSLVYALLFVRRQPDLSKLPTTLLEMAFVYSAVAYERGGPGGLPDALWEAVGLELLARKARCSVDFHMAVDWTVLAWKSTNLAFDFDAPMCKEAEIQMRNIQVIAGMCD